MPIGVARLSLGRGGREGWPTPPAPAPTGLTFGEGGIASPRRGVRAPPPLAPGMAGRRRGAGAFIMGTGFGDWESIGACGSCGFDMCCTRLS